MSDEDIAAGSRWLPEIAGELSEARAGILCVTPENQISPWLVFEAGALSKTIDQTFVCPMLFGMSPSQLSGPLAQFQAATFERSGVLRVLHTLNSAFGAEKLPEQDLEETFEVWWPRLEARLAETPFSTEPVTTRRSNENILEEVLSLSREQLRRENLRLEHSQARDDRLDQVLPMFGQMASSAQQMADRGRLLMDAVGQHSLPVELMQLLTGGDAPAAAMNKMLSVLQEQSRQSREETQELLSPPPQPSSDSSMKP